MASTPNTQHYGFTRVGAGESLSKNGYAGSDLDRVALDKILYALENHTHSGDPSLGGPTDPPGLTTSISGGNIPAGTTLFYKVAFVDKYDLETYSSTESSITTAAAINFPSGVSLSLNNAGGTLGVGTYTYSITFLDASGGETSGSPAANFQVTSGTANRVRLDLPPLPSGAVAYGIYRSRPGQTKFYKLSTSITTTPYYDTGAAEDQTVTVPSINTTNSSNSVTITIPGSFIPEGCGSWTIYRATQSGGYTGASLVHKVVEGATPTDPTPVTTYIDTGVALGTGMPISASRTISGGKVIDLNEINGVLPLSAIPRGAQSLNIFTPGTITNSQIMHVTESPNGIKPVRFTGYLKTDNSSSGVSVKFRVQDSAGTPNFVDLVCSSSTHISGDPTGYYRVEFPLLASAFFEAETGTRSSGVLIDNDITASGGQAVTLASNNDYVQCDLGALDTGSYSTFITFRVINFDTVHTGNDITISVIRTDTSAVVGSPVTYNLQSTTPSDPLLTPTDFIYVRRVGPVITAPGGIDLVLRITKSLSTSSQSYDVDSMDYSAVIPELQAGTLTTTAIVTGGTTNAADVNLTLWF